MGLSSAEKIISHGAFSGLFCRLCASSSMQRVDGSTSFVLRGSK